MKKIILLILLTTCIFADSKITIVPYASIGSYNSSISDSDSLLGLYYLIKADTYSFDLAIESKKLDYIDGTKLDQLNLASSYKTNFSNNVKINALLHYISNDAQSDGTIITLIEADKTYKNNLVLGLELAYSLYNTETLTKNMLQIRPSLRLNYGRPDSKWGTIHPRISFYYMKPITQNAITLQSSYISTELGITHAKGSFISSASIWFGEQLYAVRDGGFTVYNLNELHTNGYSLSSRYLINKNLGVKISYSNEDYQTYNTSDALGTNIESINRVLLVTDFSF